MTHISIRLTIIMTHINMSTYFVIPTIQNNRLIIIYAGTLESNCPKSHFLCTNDICVTGSVLCDGNDDCGDGSDETKGCTGNAI